MWNALRLCAALCLAWRGIAAAPATETTAAATSTESASTDFLSDEQWLQLPREVRQARFSRAFLARIEPTGYGTADKLGDYIERYRRAVILDPRLAVFDVRAAVLDARQRRIALTGEVSLSQYRTGLESALRSLGFSIVRNDVTVLPAASLGKAVYAVSTTFSATMRREPRARAEQVNSIALGWPMRLLRQARPDDLTTSGAAAAQGDRAGRRGRRSTAGTGTEAALAVDQWLLAQSAEGYLGFVRSDEIRRVETYRLPDSILVLPTTATLAGTPALVLPTGTGLRKLAQGRWAVPLATGDIEIDRIKKLQRRILGLSEKAEKLFMESIWSLVQALEAKDAYARKHSEHVAAYAVGIARTMALGPKYVDLIRRAAMIHDIGKIGIPDAVLFKTDPLTAQERRVIEQHPLIAVKILEKMSFLESEVALIRHHHEKWNGQGYPDGLARTAIPLGARVIAAADVFDALTSSRAYHEGRSVRTVLAMLRDSCGYEFDPAVVVALDAWVESICRETAISLERLTVEDLLAASEPIRIDRQAAPQEADSPQLVTAARTGSSA